MDLGHHGYKGLLTSQREMTDCYECPNGEHTPASGVRSLNLHVIKGPGPTSHFQRTERTRALLHDSTEVQSGNSKKLCKTNDLVSSADCNGKNKE